MLTKLKKILKKVLPSPIFNILKFLHYWKNLISSICFFRDDTLNGSFKEKLRIIKQLYVISSYADSPNTQDKMVTFFRDDTLNGSFKEKLYIINQMYVISSYVDCPHSQDEMLTFIRTILSLPAKSNGVIVEAGCFKGGSSAKFSLAADIVGRDLVVFDSFEGIPENDEAHDKNIFGGTASFKEGDYSGSLEEVKLNISRFGKIDRCRFVKGWLEDTLPYFGEPISAAYLDVDLASSTRTCLKYIYPLLESDGVLFSQDGHLPLVIDVFNDEDFWLKEVGCKKPLIQGLGKKKLIKIIKEA